MITMHQKGLENILYWNIFVIGKRLRNIDFRYDNHVDRSEIKVGIDNLEKTDYHIIFCRYRGSILICPADAAVQSVYVQ